MEDQYRRLFEENPQVMWVYDPETLAFLAVNRAATEQYGYTADEFLRLTIKDLHPEADWPALAERPSRGLERYRGTWRHRTRSGRMLDVDVRSHRVQWAGREARIATIDDITERKALEEQLRQSQKMEAIGQLAGGVAHDFNNLLTAIQGYADLLEDRFEQEPGKREDLNEIRLAAQRAATLTRQLLAFSRKQFLAPKVLRMADVVAGITPMLNRLIGETIELKTLASGRGVVLADEGQLEQILVNLVVNSRDAMPHGGRITIETSEVALDATYTEHHPDVPAGRYVMIAVSDNGCGMDKETQSRAFEPFFTTKPKDQGTGLGLATVYGIVKQSDGYISIYSEVGHGTTFKILLPLAGSGSEGAGEEVARASATGGVERILVVEDEDMVREFVLRTLRRSGYSVLVAANPIEALAIADCEPAIDLLITDVVLPDMKGPALASEMRSRHPECRVLYMSGYTENLIVRQGWHEGGMEFLQKPFSLQTLRAKVREILDRPAA